MVNLDNFDIIVNVQEGCGEVRTSFSVLCEDVGHSQNV